MNKKIFITFEKEGFHCWPDAPDEVSFLRNKHRHLFNFRVEISVGHDDRDIEFFLFKNELVEYIGHMERFQNDVSCEMICERIINYLEINYSNRKVRVEVSEDGENGAVVDNY